ncbi:MAG: glycosyltransferase [Anaerolineae bacterium]
MAESHYRILMVAPTSFFADYGCHVRILEEARVLQALGHEVAIVTYARGRDLPDVTIHRTPPLPYHATYDVGSSRHKFAFDAYLAPTVLSVGQRFRPDIVHGHLHEGALLGFPWSLVGGAPLVFDFQGSMTAEMLDHHFLRPGGKREWFFRQVESAINRLPDAVVTSTERAALQYNAATPGRHARPIPDVVNPHMFRPGRLAPDERAALRAQWGIPPDADVVVYLGLLAHYQGVDHLLRAAAAICAVRPNAHFLIMGYPNVEHYKEMAQGLGLAGRVTFTGRVAYEDSPRMLALGDVAVAPKLSQTEGAGKLLTYMSMALPTVAFDTLVAREYMSDLGLYAPAGHIVALTTALVRVLDDPQRAALGERLRAHVTRAFPWEGVGHALVDVYEDALARRGKTPPSRLPPSPILGEGMGERDASSAPPSPLPPFLPQGAEGGDESLAETSSPLAHFGRGGGERDREAR